MTFTFNRDVIGPLLGHQLTNTRQRASLYSLPARKWEEPGSTQKLSGSARKRTRSIGSIQEALEALRKRWKQMIYKKYTEAQEALGSVGSTQEALEALRKRWKQMTYKKYTEA